MKLGQLRRQCISNHDRLLPILVWTKAVALIQVENTLRSNVQLND